MQIRTLRYYLWVTVLSFVCAVISFHPVHTSDTFWHLMQGRGVLENSARVIPEPTAFHVFPETTRVAAWLWDLTTYFLFHAGGWPALHLLMVALVCLTVFAVTAMARRYGGRESVAATVLVSGLTMVVVMSRMQIRPQAAFLLLLPLFMELTGRYVGAAGRVRVKLGMGVGALAILWAQLHGSFVLAPAIFFILALPVLWKEWHSRERVSYLLTVFLLLLAMLSSSSGIDVIRYIGEHGAGDGKIHITDMLPPGWSAFNPIQKVYGFGYLMLWLLSLLGATVARRIWWRELGLAVLGLFLVMNAARFFAAGAVLAAPLAMRGTEALREHFRSLKPSFAAAMAAALVGVALIGVGLRTDKRFGPLGGWGLARGEFPEAAARYLESAPDGANILTSYAAGGPLGFWFAGRLRTFIDGRTLVYFDDTDFAVHRDMMRDPGALARGLKRFDVYAVVVERDSSTCRNMPSGWVPVVVEPRFTTFVRKAVGRGLTLIAPCSGGYLAPDACSDSRVLDRELELLRAVEDRPFFDLLRAERIARCGNDLGEALSLVPDPSEAAAYLRYRDTVKAYILLRQNKVREAIDEVYDYVLSGDPSALALLFLAIQSGHLPDGVVEPLLREVTSSLDDEAPAWAREELALLCAGEGDMECARFNGIRAGVVGGELGEPVLRWLAELHPSKRARADAARWLETITEKSPTPPAVEE